MTNHFECIVVGGGPVGTWIACELKRAGIHVAVLERRSTPTRQSRALTIHGRSLELFALRGIADRLLAVGKPIPTGHYAILDTRLDFSPFETRFPYTLFVPQALTEAELGKHAQELGVDIRRGIEVKSIYDLGDRVHLNTGDGEYSADYVVGADGARSIVRDQAGIGFEGFAERNTLILADVVLGVPPAEPIISLVNEAGAVMIAPLGDGKHHRIVLVDPHQASVSKSELVSLESVSQSVQRILGRDFELRDPIWTSRFTDETRLARTYNKGRVLLAGDAAHIHAPMGGQGMNVGLQDAMNLAWKLAAVIRGEAPQSLLNTYTAERRPVGERLYSNTLAQVGLVTRFDPTVLAMRSTLNDLLEIPAVNRRFAGELSGFDVAYGPEAEKSMKAGKLDAGVRIPDIELIIGRASTSIHTLLKDAQWLHIAFEASAKAPRPEWLPDKSIRFEIAAPQNPGKLSELNAILVRPDGYVWSITNTME